MRFRSFFYFSSTFYYYYFCFSVEGTVVRRSHLDATTVRYTFRAVYFYVRVYRRHSFGFCHYLFLTSWSRVTSSKSARPDNANRGVVNENRTCAPCAYCANMNCSKTSRVRRAVYEMAIREGGFKSARVCWPLPPPPLAQSRGIEVII